MSKKVSVIIPCYNVEKYMEKCIDSVICQSYENIEILVVNDGSKDSTEKIGKSYEEKDSRVRLLNKENGGLSSARNEGLKYMTGEYCYFLDGDDYLDEDGIEFLVKLMEEKGADIAVGGTRCVDEKGSIFPAEPIKDKLYSIEGEKERFKFYYQIYYNYQIRYEVWNKLFKTSIIKDNGISFENNYKIFAEDICFISYYLVYTNRIAVSSKVFHNYLLRGDSIMGSLNGDSKLNNIIELIKHVDDFISAHSDDQYLRDNYKKASMCLVHDRMKWVKINKIKNEVKKITPENKDFLKEISYSVLGNKKEFKKEFNKIQPLNRKMGESLLEESKIYLYGDKIYYYIIIVSIMGKRFFRMLKRKVNS